MPPYGGSMPGRPIGPARIIDRPAYGGSYVPMQYETMPPPRGSAIPVIRGSVVPMSQVPVAASAIPFLEPYEHIIPAMPTSHLEQHPVVVSHSQPVVWNL